MSLYRFVPNTDTSTYYLWTQISVSDFKSDVLTLVTLTRYSIYILLHFYHLHSQEKMSKLRETEKKVEPILIIGASDIAVIIFYTYNGPMYKVQGLLSPGRGCTVGHHVSKI